MPENEIPPPSGGYLFGLLAALHKGTEHGPAGGMGLQILGMPLHCQQEGVIGAGHGLHDAVRGKGLSLQGRSQLPDTLMMEAVDADLAAAGDLLQHAAMFP